MFHYHVVEGVPTWKLYGKNNNIILLFQIISTKQDVEGFTSITMYIWNETIWHIETFGIRILVSWDEKDVLQQNVE